MSELIKIKRGFTAGIEPFGLTLGELAANLGDGRLFVGGTYGNAIVLGGGGIATNLPQASDSITGVASFNSSQFIVSPTGHVSLSGGSITNVILNIDGGAASSVYGGVSGLDGGTAGTY